MASSIRASEAVLCRKQAEGPRGWSAREADPWINPDLFSVLWYIALLEKRRGRVPLLGEVLFSWAAFLPHGIATIQRCPANSCVLTAGAGLLPCRSTCNARRHVGCGFFCWFSTVHCPLTASSKNAEGMYQCTPERLFVPQKAQLVA